MTAACESEWMPERRALVRYLYTLNVFMYNDLGPSAGSRTEKCLKLKQTLYHSKLIKTSFPYRYMYR